MSTMCLRRITVLVSACLVGCLDEPAPERSAEDGDHSAPPVVEDADHFALPLLVVPDEGPVAAVSVAAMDRPTSELVTLDATWPLEARMLILSPPRSRR